MLTARDMHAQRQEEGIAADYEIATKGDK